MMEHDEILEALNVAEDKGQLEALGRDFLGVEVDKRKGLETIRQQLVDEVKGLPVEKLGDGSEQGSDMQLPEENVSSKSQQRLLKHEKNGRTFVYTEALAKPSHMVEVEG